MILIDTHTHLYLEEFNNDRNEVVERALNNDVRYMLLPNIDSGSIEPMLDLHRRFPANCLPMMGLHPTSVNENFEKELDTIEKMFGKEKFYGVGEIGIDLYWDKTFVEEQKEALARQLETAKKLQIPAVIHSRESFDEIFEVLSKHTSDSLTGVFHCFTGNRKQAFKVLDFGFKLGIGGVLTFKNSGLKEVIKDIELKHLLLETDSPYLTPVPFRGKRNESSYVIHIAKKLAEIQGVSIDKVAEITTGNAVQLFKIPV